MGSKQTLVHLANSIFLFVTLLMDSLKENIYIRIIRILKDQVNNLLSIIEREKKKRNNMRAGNSEQLH